MGSNRIHSNHSVFNISYHIVWIPKYRKRILVGEIREYTKIVLFKKASQLGILIEACEIMSDHVHLFVKAKPTISVPFMINQLKGYSSYMLRKKFKELRKYRSLWVPSYFVETIGFISEETVKKYINMQINNHT